MANEIEEIGMPLSNGRCVKTNPNKADTDGDGINDKEDTAPLIIGLKGGIISSIQICSSIDGCTSSFLTGRHAWLVYKSYIKDTIDLNTGLYAELKDKELLEFAYSDIGKLNLKRGGIYYYWNLWKQRR